MNVLVVGHAQIRESNRDVYRELAKLGFDVTLLVPKRWTSTYGNIDVESPDDPELAVVARSIAGRHHSNMYWYVGGVAPAAEACRADAIYVDEDPAGFAALQAARVARRRRARLVVLAVQNIFKRYPPPFDAIQRFVLGTATAAVSNSRDASATLRRRGYDGAFFQKPLTTGLVPLDPLARAALRERYGIRGFTAGFAGRLVKEKGVDVFIDALASTPGVRGLVAGDGPERAALGERARRLGIGDRLTFVGALSSSEAAALIGALDALVLPSRTIPSWSEQFGRVLVEAMAAGTPIVASASGAIPEVLGDAGLLVREGAADELARAILRLSDGPFAAELARRGRARALARFSSRAVAAELDRALRYPSTGALRE